MRSSQPRHAAPTKIPTGRVAPLPKLSCKCTIKDYPADSGAGMSIPTVGYWQTTVSPEARPALEGPIFVDVAIVGGGFTGLSTARALLQTEPGLRVAVLE